MVFRLSGIKRIDTSIGIVLNLNMNIYKKAKQLINDIKCIRQLRKTLSGQVISVMFESNGSYDDVSKVFDALQNLSTSTGCAIITSCQTQKLKASDLIKTNHFTPITTNETCGMGRGRSRYRETTQEHLDESIRKFRENIGRIYRK